MIGGLLAEISHVLVFSTALPNLGSTVSMLMLIASGLFFIETGVFLGVVTAFRRTSPTTNPTSPSGTYYQDNANGGTSLA